MGSPYKIKRYDFRSDTLSLTPGYRVISLHFWPVYERSSDPKKDLWYDFDASRGTTKNQDKAKKGWYLWLNFSKPANKGAEEIKKNELKKEKEMVTKHQQGGTAPQLDLQLQIIQLVQAAAGGDLQATLQIEQILQAAQQGDQQAMQIAQMIQQVVQAMKLQKVKALYGAKLDYIKRLKGVCPEGEELQYYREGGMIKAKCGCKTLKASEGDTLTVKKQNPVLEFKSKKRKLDPATTKTLPNGKYPENWTGADRAKWERIHGQDEGDAPKDFDGKGGRKGEKWTPKKACGSKMKKN